MAVTDTDLRRAALAEMRVQREQIDPPQQAPAPREPETKFSPEFAGSIAADLFGEPKSAQATPRSSGGVISEAAASPVRQQQSGAPAAFTEPPESVTATYRPVIEGRGSVSTIPGNPNAASELAALTARQENRALVNEQDRRNGIIAAAATADRQVAAHDLQRAESEARVDRFRVLNGADAVLRGSQNPGAERRNRAAIADASAAKAAYLYGRANAPVNQPSSIIGDTVALSDAANRTAVTEQGRQASVIQNAIGQEQLAREKRMNQLGNVLATAQPGTPEHTKASQAMLSILGKDRPDQYKVHSIVLPDRMSPDGNYVLRGGSAIAVVGPDGKSEIIRLGQQDDGQAPTKKFAEGQIYTDPVSKKSARYVDGKWVPI